MLGCPWRLLASVAGLGLAWACSGANVFECSDAAECGADGVCSDGYCAFPDAACPSGYSYGRYAPSALAGECVPDDSSATDASTGVDATTSTSTTGPSPESSAANDTTDTGDAVDDGSTSTSSGGTSSATTGGGPWLDDWPNRLPIVVDGSQVAGSLADFDVLVQWASNEALASAGLELEALRFAAFDQPLAYEIEAFDAASGALVAWVQLPELEAGVDTEFHLYYGGVGGGALEGDPWAEYGAVWHLSLDEVGDVPDATVNANDGASIGAALVSEAGKIADAVRFDGVDDGITIDHDPSLRFGPALTVSAWVLADAFEEDASTIFGKATTYGSTTQNAFYLRAYDAWLEFVVKVPDLQSAAWNGYGQDQLGAWHHVVGVHDGETIRLYFDGVEVDSSPAASEFSNTVHPLRIGSWGEGTAAGLATRTWDGLIDEVRLTTNARGADWVATEYANQHAPEMFSSVGPSQSAP
jgi:hypothetical protein